MAVVVAVAPAIECHAQSSALRNDQQRIDRYVSAGKFDFAEFYCREQLSNPKITLNRRAAITNELLRVFQQHATTLPADERKKIWDKSTKLTDEYLRKDAASPQRFLIQLQAATLQHSRAWLRLVETARPNASNPPAAVVVSNLRSANRQLRDLGQSMDEFLRSRKRDPNAKGHMSDRELRQLRARVQLAAARLDLTLAMAYPPGGDDRILAASRAASGLNKLAPTAINDTLWQSSRIELLTALRLKEDWSGYTRQLRTMAGVKLSGTTKELRDAEVLRAAIDREKWDEVQRRVAKAGVGRASESRLAALEAYLALAARAKKASDSTNLAADWQKRAVDFLDESRKSASKLWLRRADALLVSASTGSNNAGGSMAAYSVRAEALYRQDRLEESAAAYDAAAQQAKKAGDAQSAFDLSLRSSAIMIESDKLQDAVNSLRQLAMGNSGDSRAAGAHLLAIRTLLKKVRDSDSDSSAYRELLDEHIATWPSESETADQVRMWRGQVHEHFGAFEPAVVDYTSVSPDSRLLAEALVAAERCYTALHDRGVGISDGLRYLERIAGGWRNESRKEVLNQAAVSCLRLHTRAGRDGDGNGNAKGSGTETLSPQLTRLKKRMADSSFAQPLLDEARFAMVVGLALNEAGSADDAIGELLKKITTRNKIDWLRAVQGTANAPAKSRMIILNFVAGLRLELEDVESQLVAKSLASALFDDGQIEQARIKFEELAKRLPRDGDVMEGVAKTLPRDTAIQQEVALAAWRKVLAGSRPQSPRWFRGKYAVADLLVGTGQAARAAEMIDLLSVLHPEMGGADMKQQFVGLRKRCDIADGQSDQ